jgi:hypothetical protein
MTDRKKHTPAELALAGGGMLALYFRQCLQAETEGRPMPSPEDSLTLKKAGATIGPAYDMILDLTGACDCPAHRKALQLFMGAFADIIARHGAELEGMLHALMFPNEPDTYAYVVRVRAGENGEIEETSVKGF